MKHMITLQKSTFATLLASLYKPNPEDPDGGGPGGPVMRHLADALRWRELNPQPIPPEEVYRLGQPQPIPWRAARYARELISRARGQYEFAAVVAGGEPAPKSTAVIGTQLFAYVDELCPRIPFPRPRRFGETESLALLAAAAEFQIAAATSGPLQESFEMAADRLFDGALARMESQQEAPPQAA